jgi:predicted outer membrane repeat protein
VKISHCALIDNICPGSYGGGMIIANATEVNDCVFVDNSAGYGGAISVMLFSPTIINCTFNGNHATQTGGAIDSTLFGSPVITNCILWGDTADVNGNEIYGSATVTYSDVQGGHAGTGNINSDPNFVDDTDPDGNDDQYMTSDDGLAIDANSPCIDVANGDVAPPKDILDNSRYDDPNKGPGVGDPNYVDMGAYEYQGS